MEILPYSGPLPATDLLLKDGVSGSTYAVTLTSDDALTWATTSAGVGMDSFVLTDQVTGAAHSLSLQNGALTY